MIEKRNRFSSILDIIVASLAFGGAYYVGKSNGFEYTGPVSTVAALITITVLLAVRGTNWGSLGLRRPRTFLSVLLALVLAAVVVAVTVVLVLTLMPMLESYVGQLADSDRFANITGNLQAYLFVIIFIAWGAAAFGEEMLFRGFLMTRVSELFGGGATAWGVAVVVQALIFGLLHFSQGPFGIIQTGLIGLIMGVFVLVARRNLWPVILAHGAIDTISLTQIYAGAG